MSLKTGKKIGRRTWDEIPMPEMVIERVETLGKDQLELFAFTDRQGRVIGDVELPGVNWDENKESQDSPAHESVDREIGDLDDLEPNDPRNDQTLDTTPDEHQQEQQVPLIEEDTDPDDHPGNQINPNDVSGEPQEPNKVETVHEHT